MRKRTQIAAIFCAAALAASALAIQYTWTGDSDSEWDNVLNWYAGGVLGYPQTLQDDALFPTSATRYTVNLIKEEIDDVEIRASYDFRASGEPPVLTVNSFIINASGSETPIVVSMTGAEILKDAAE